MKVEEQSIRHVGGRFPRVRPKNRPFPPHARPAVDCIAGICRSPGPGFCFGVCISSEESAFLCSAPQDLASNFPSRPSGEPSMSSLTLRPPSSPSSNRTCRPSSVPPPSSLNLLGVCLALFEADRSKLRLEPEDSNPSRWPDDPNISVRDGSKSALPPGQESIPDSENSPSSSLPKVVFVQTGVLVTQGDVGVCLRKSRDRTRRCNNS